MENGQRATIVDIAQLAGVSVSTVSRVINGKPDVAPHTRESVLRAMTDRGFVANPAARSLVGARTRLIGVLARTVNSAFASGVLQGVMEVAEETGYGLLLLPIEMDSAGPLAGMLHSLADGLIIASPGIESRLDLEALDKRLVYIEQRSGTPEHGVTVTTSNRAGTAGLARHLLDFGHRRIAFITGPRYLESSQERLKGYQEAIDAAGIPRDDRLIVPGSFDHASGMQAARQLIALADPPTAIMASNDREAFGVLQALRDANIRVPDDLSVVGFDDVPLAAETEPALTTLHQPVYEMGRTAMTLLVDWIEGTEPVQRTVELPTRLMARASSSPPSR